ncbi:POK19 protein, partial [Rhodinocichla rosea]|nr:POK19 protein [Rhodinocichla rosea]
NHACHHFLQAFASLGVPQEVKTDNGPAYISQKLATFLKEWGVHHIFGIPHSPTSKAIIEKAHQT